ncbi:MAG: type I toxin-antitoxin system SymE family toxin [Cyclobacteriaceae bacterium]|nr:type I toxin-antitoxin system SymE family toxin [Cyclobacteriaceae bacterium]
MEQLGFTVGDQVSITTRDRLLIIEPQEVSEPEQDYKSALKKVRQVLKKIG